MENKIIISVKKEPSVWTKINLVRLKAVHYRSDITKKGAWLEVKKGGSFFRMAEIAE